MEFGTIFVTDIRTDDDCKVVDKEYKLSLHLIVAADFQICDDRST